MRKFGKHFWDNKTFVISADSDQPAHPHVRGRYNFTQTVLYGGKMSPGTTNFAQLCITHTLRGLASVVR